MKRIFSIALLAVLALLVSACAPQADTSAGMDADATTQMNSFTVDLSGDQEVPPVSTLATGVAEVDLDGNMLNVTGTFRGLESDLMAVAGTPMHIHEAPAGENGDVVFLVDVDMDADNRSGSFSFSGELTDEQVETFRAGNYYLNIHTEENGGGALRGQLVPRGM